MKNEESPTVERSKAKTSKRRRQSMATVHSVIQLFRLDVDLIYGFACIWLKNDRTKWAERGKKRNKRKKKKNPNNKTSAQQYKSPNKHRQQHLLDVVRSSFSIDCLLPTVRILNVMTPTFGRWKPTGCASYVTAKETNEKKKMLVENWIRWFFYCKFVELFFRFHFASVERQVFAIGEAFRKRMQNHFEIQYK